MRLIKIAWGITGAGDQLEQIIELMKNLKRKHGFAIEVYVSKSGDAALRHYNLWDDLRTEFSEVQLEENANSPFLAGKLQTGYYRILIVAPATANTVAKIGHGIADTLITNAVAQADKSNIPVYIYPTDRRRGEIETKLPNGKRMTLYIRAVDAANVDLLRKMDNIVVLDSLDDIEDAVTRFSINLHN